MFSKFSDMINGGVDMKSLLDGTANIGTDVLNFSKYIPSLNYITAIELGYTEYVLLVKNIERVKASRLIQHVNGNIVDYIMSDEPHNPRSHDIVYLDPPWGGLNWKENVENPLSMTHSDGRVFGISHLVDTLVAKKLVNSFVIVKTPSNFKPIQKSVLSATSTKRFTISNSIHVFIVVVDKVIVPQRNVIATSVSVAKQLLSSDSTRIVSGPEDNTVRNRDGIENVPLPQTKEYKAYVESNGILFKSDRLEQGGSFLSNVWGETDGVTDPAKRSSINTFAVNATEGGFDAESHHFVSAEHYYYWKRAGLLDREYQQKIFIDTPTPSSNTYALYGGIKFYKIWIGSISHLNLSNEKRLTFY
jgi:hypothetical protein